MLRRSGLFSCLVVTLLECGDSSPLFLFASPRRVNRHYLKQAGKAEAMAALRNAAISVLNLVPLFDPKEPIRARADRLNRDPDLAVTLFTTSFS
jgi:hypothetical protein